MRSSEIAKLAGVTVRTLRHYHALGLLPEPERKENGYRDYGPAELVALLRIKRLASLGFSLEQIKRMLGEGRDELRDQALDGSLEALDRELAARIEELERQRKVIAELRAQGTRADVPPEYGRFVAALAERTTGEGSVALEADTILLAEALLPSKAKEFLLSYYRGLLADGGIDAYASLNERLLALDEGSLPQERQEVVDGFVDLLAPCLVDLCDVRSLADVPIADAVVEVFDEFDDVAMNDVQREVCEQINDVLVDILLKRGVLDAEYVKSLGHKTLDPDVTS